MGMTDDFKTFLKSVGMILVGIAFFFLLGFDQPFTIKDETEKWFLLFRIFCVVGPLAVGLFGVVLALYSEILSLIFFGLERFFKKVQQTAK